MEEFKITTEKLLSNWGTVNSILIDLSEEQMKKLIAYEQKHKNREIILKRLHQRYNVLRNRRERNDLTKNSNS